MAGLMAGVAEVNITPPIGISLCGFGGRKGPSESIHDDLYARALVLDDGGARLGIVTADVISFAPDLVDRMRELAGDAAGIPEGHLTLNGSHTHSGPAVMAFRSMGDRDPAYEDVLCRKVAGALKMATNGLAPALLSVGRAPVRIGYNRREKRDGRMVLGHNPGGPEAPWVDVLRIDGTDGAPLGLFYTIASHPVSLNQLAVSADYPGVAAQFIRRNFGGAVPIFAQGCCGDINCSPKDNTFETTRRLGTTLGCAAVAAAVQAEPLEGCTLAARCRSIDLPLSHPTVEAGERALEEQRVRFEGAKRDGKATSYQLRHQYGGQVAWSEDYLRAAQEGEGRAQPFEVQTIRIGDLALVAYPGEMFVDYQLTMDRESPFARTFTLGYSNGCIGYVPTADAYSEGGYEINSAYRYYGTLMIKSDCEGMIKQTTLEMLEELKKS